MTAGLTNADRLSSRNRRAHSRDVKIRERMKATQACSVVEDALGVPADHVVPKKHLIMEGRPMHAVRMEIVKRAL